MTVTTTSDQETRRRRTVIWVVSLATVGMVFDGFDRSRRGRDTRRLTDHVAPTPGMLASRRTGRPLPIVMARNSARNGPGTPRRFSALRV